MPIRANKEFVRSGVYRYGFWRTVHAVCRLVVRGRIGRDTEVLVGKGAEDERVMLLCNTTGVVKSEPIALESLMASAIIRSRSSSGREMSTGSIVYYQNGLSIDMGKRKREEITV